VYMGENEPGSEPDLVQETHHGILASVLGRSLSLSLSLYIYIYIYISFSLFWKISISLSHPPTRRSLSHPSPHSLTHIRTRSLFLSLPHIKFSSLLWTLVIDHLEKLDPISVLFYPFLFN
jgi:hypothetical protein